MRYLLPLGLVAVVLVSIGCESKPPHQVNIAPPPDVQDTPGENEPPRLNEIRPLDAGAGAVDESDQPEQKPTPAGDTAAQRLSEVPKDQQPGDVDTSRIRIYRIQAGDTYWNIAVRILGDGHRWKEIKELNPKVDAKNLKIGQTIRLPVK